MELTALLLAEGLADDAAIDRAQARAKSARRPLAEVLVDDGVLAEDVLADTVARAVGTVVFDLAQGTLEAGAAHVLPEAVARRHLAVAVSDPSSGTLRVAFADPLDGEATAAVRDATGREIAALVGTISGIKAVLDRAFGAHDRIDLPPETTRRVEGAPAVRTSTAPAHRIAEEATIEQRHEALLLALIESGALARADYVDALRRLLGRKD